jgi:hypothetical protein
MKDLESQKIKNEGEIAMTKKKGGGNCKIHMLRICL